PATAGKGAAVEFAEGDVVGDAHAADTGIFQRLLRQERHSVPSHLFARGVIDVADHADFAALRLALAGKHLDELPLAIAGNPGDADDFSAAHRKRNVVDRDRAGIVKRLEFIELEPGSADFSRPR